MDKTLEDDMCEFDVECSALAESILTGWGSYYTKRDRKTHLAALDALYDDVEVDEL